MILFKIISKVLSDIVNSKIINLDNRSLDLGSYTFLFKENIQVWILEFNKKFIYENNENKSYLVLVIKG